VPDERVLHVGMGTDDMLVLDYDLERRDGDLES
jgi:hypothetical protein